MGMSGYKSYTSTTKRAYQDGTDNRQLVIVEILRVLTNEQTDHGQDIHDEPAGVIKGL